MPGKLANSEPASVPTVHLVHDPAARHGHPGFNPRRSPGLSALLIVWPTQGRAVDFLYVAHLPALLFIANDGDALTRT